MNRLQSSPARIGSGDVYERLAKRLEDCLAQDRSANQAKWILIEDEKLTQARLLLFGSAPK